ncbi:hypothetical protein [Streptomyces shenzhenensis]|uniref:Uncharacterized protein n=1 Tax=Streptomyces shenzhenensis TaxID=943815 RepID=A0A3M0I8G8_9ACTN|nr:hypothetical protein [Streptomyces shenzhenensis]RMB84612.1 hypothetical protein CTZ28_17990 [Streptomyces shenzhenensis]
MAGSDSGASSTASHAGSYRSVRVRRSGEVEDSGRTVPDDAPTPLREALVSVYNQGTDEYYAITLSSSGSAYRAQRWDQRAAKWARDNKGTVARALLDVAPSLIQGAANFVPEGLARTAVKAVGISAQAALAGYDAYQLYQQDQADPLRVAAVAGRAVSTGLNMYSATGEQGMSTAMAGGAANWAAGAATVTKAVADAMDPALPMYRQRANLPLQDLPSRFQPPPAGTPASAASTESFHTAHSTLQTDATVPVPPLTTRPVRDFSPPSSRDSQYSGRSSGPSSGRTATRPQARYTSYKPKRQEGGSSPGR